VYDADFAIISRGAAKLPTGCEELMSIPLPSKVPVPHPVVLNNKAQ
jgi:hypothetical protein